MSVASWAVALRRRETEGECHIQLWEISWVALVAKIVLITLITHLYWCNYCIFEFYFFGGKL